MNRPTPQPQQDTQFDPQRARRQMERMKQALQTPIYLGIATDANTYGGRTSLQQVPFTQLQAALQANQKLRLLLPSIWRREITRNIQRAMLQALGNEKAQLDKARGIKEAGVVAALDLAYARIQAACDAAAAEAERVTSSYFQACNAMDLPISADIRKIIDMYFLGVPPFEPEKGKPNEYRDAISLLDLDAYAERENIEVVVVSRDGGCMRFCDDTKRLIGIERLDELFEALQSHEELIPMEALETSLDNQLRNNPAKLWRELTARMMFAVSRQDWSPLTQLAVKSQEKARHRFQQWFTEPVGEAQFQPFSDGRLLRLKSAYGDDLSIEVQVRTQVKVFAAGHYIRKGDKEFHAAHYEVTGEVTLGIEAYIRVPGRNLENLEDPGSFEAPGSLLSLTVAAGTFPQIQSPDPEEFEYVAVA